MAADNTFATPFLQSPLDLSADIVMHSVTKYIAGHSDVIMVALICKGEDLAKRLYFIQKSSGAVFARQDGFLALRGIKTLHLRMQRHCKNGKIIATFLKTHPKVDKVYCPGFKEHPNHLIAKKQMRDYGGMISFSLNGNSKEDVFKLVSTFKIFKLAQSLGGVESLTCHPATLTHAPIPRIEREKSGIVESLIPLSVGVEDIHDLIEDLDSALKLI